MVAGEKKFFFFFIPGGKRPVAENMSARVRPPFAPGKPDQASIGRRRPFGVSYTEQIAKLVSVIEARRRGKQNICFRVVIRHFFIRGFVCDNQMSVAHSGAALDNRADAVGPPVRHFAGHLLKFLRICRVPV